MGVMDKFNFSKLFESVIKGLKNQPLLLFAFGTIIVIFAFAIISPKLGGPSQSIQSWEVIGGYSLMAGVLVVVMFSIHRFTAVPAIDTVPIPRQVEPSGAIDPQPKPLALMLNTLSKNYVDAMKVMPSRILKEIDYEMSHLVQNSNAWVNGEIYPLPERYDRMLIDSYAEAQQTIFSTCVKEYLGTWEKSLGEELLSVHENGMATVQRVFILDNKKDVTTRLHKIIRKQYSTKHVQAFVLIASEADISYPISLIKDFTIIDGGKVVAITQTYGISNLRARWTFTKNPENSAIVTDTLDVKRELMAKCMTADKFLSRYSPIDS